MAAQYTTSAGCLSLIPILRVVDSEVVLAIAQGAIADLVTLHQSIMLSRQAS